MSTAYGELYVGPNDGSAPYDTDSGDGCMVWADHSYNWNALDPPRNNAPHEESLYPGDVVPGAYSWESEGCCRINTSFDSVGDWSDVTGSAGSYTQHMVIVPNEPVPGAETYGSFLQTATYDGEGRSRTHQQGVTEGHGLVSGTTFTINGYVRPPGSEQCSKLVATVTLHSDFRYRNPFWETSIFEHHVLASNGYPASNLDYSQYKHDAIPLEAGSNLVLGGYRWETIRITHELEGADIASEFHCTSKTCSIDLPAADTTPNYVGNRQYEGAARNPPWEEPNGGTTRLLDDGEAIFSAVAAHTGQLDVISTMWNINREVARGYNSTWQFVQSYEPVLDMTPVTNTALGGDSALERPVSVIIEYNGTISDILHYCSAGAVYDRDGLVVPIGEYGEADAWDRRVGETCPEERPANQWGVVGGGCGGGPCSYVVHPEKPNAFGWGRWSAANPETRALLDGFAGGHVICGESCTTHDTPYLNWDYVPGTDRDFIPACVMADIAAEGGSYTNQPKPENWGLGGDWLGNTIVWVGEDAEPYSYRGLFTSGPPPKHYTVDHVQCEAELGERECVPRGSECKPEYDRRCESVFEPYLYPDDYIMAGHVLLQEMVLEWCGPSPTDTCAAEAYRTIDGVMVAMCSSTVHNVDYSTYSQVIDTGVMGIGTSLSPNLCHNMYANGVFAPGDGGVPVADWRACYGVIPGESDPPAVWPDGMPDVDPAALCRPTPGGSSPVLPFWDGGTWSVYVPYTPTTGAFAGVVERPGNMLADDGTLTCSCDDTNGNDICDFSEAAGGNDLDGNGIHDDWDAPTPDGAVSCLDRTGTAAAAAASCWAKYGRDGDGLAACMAAAGNIPDGPDGECNPAVILGRILPDGTVSTDMLPAGWESVAAADTGLLSVPFLGVDGLIPIPYVVDGQHIHCDESEPWCISSGDTYEEHTRRDVCEDPDAPLSVKRIPAPATMPQLYHPVFDERWPPSCLPEYPVGEWSRPAHDISLDLVDIESQWPTIPPSIPNMGAGRTPSHVSTGEGHTMMLHAGTGVLRFDACDGCEPPLSGDGEWEGEIHTELGGQSHTIRGMMQHPPYVLSQAGEARVVAVEPCADCADGWREAVSAPGIHITLTAYPEMDTPATKPEEMAANGCQMDGDRGTGLLNAGNALAAWFAGLTNPDLPADYWNKMSCRDIPGVSITIQDYEAAKHGVAAKREAGQPWTVAEGENDVTVDVLRNGIWLSTMSILEHRGQCTVYSWSQGVTPGHTSCPATAQALSDCLYEQGDISLCFEVAAENEACADTWVEDGIHKKWEFAEGVVGSIPVVYRLPDGAYAGNGLIPMDAERLAWGSGTGAAPLRCEVAVGEDHTIHGVEHDMPAAYTDYNRGGSFACQEVQACKTTQTTHKCLGGEVVPHVTCVEPADSFSVLDMPYEEVMGNVGTQKLHVEAACPPDHVHARVSTKCDGQPVYDTHTLSSGSNSTTIYVDYFGVGSLYAGRGDQYTDTIHVRPPETFGDVHRMMVERDGKSTDVTPGSPCTTCVFEYAGPGVVTVWNVYGGSLSAEIVGVSSPVLSNVDVDDVYGVVWLYWPVLVIAVGVYLLLRRMHKQSAEVWED